MGRKAKRGAVGIAAQHLTRATALSKLQLSLADFRRLCIFKGVYPRDPKKRLKGRDKTYYHQKDVLYLWHEPLLSKFRDIKAYDKKVKKALGRNEKSIARGLVQRKPVYALYHIVKERYPTFLDCLRDLDDALSSLALFASLPSDNEKGVTADVIADATRLFDEFLLFAVHQRLLRKVFCSIKGFYIQLKYMGQLITFLIPHQFPQDLPSEVDFKVLLTFLEFYQCALKSVNFKAYQMEGLAYPPLANYKMIKAGCRYLSLSTKPVVPLSNIVITDNCKAKERGKSDSCITETESDTVARLATKLEKVTSKLAAEEEQDNHSDSDDNDDDQDDSGDQDNQEIRDGDDDDDNELPHDETTKSMNEVTEEEKRLGSLFKDKVFFISREIPRLPIAFLLQSCGASLIGWQGEGSTINEDAEEITHHILDRPIIGDLLEYESKRELIQPQWIFDSINSGVCLPVSPYKSGIPPPPHLSPFVDDLKDGYIPEQRVVLQQLTDELKRKEISMGDDDEDGLAEANEDAEDSDDDSDEDDIEKDRDVALIEAEEALHQRQIQEEIGAVVNQGDAENEQDESDDVLATKESEVSSHTRPKPSKKMQKEIEERERQKTMLSKKHKRLLHRIEFTKQKTAAKIYNLHIKKSAHNK